jgi:hypothetical protein
MGDNKWGHKVSNFKLIIARIDSGLTVVIRFRRAIRARIPVIQRKILSDFSNNKNAIFFFISPETRASRESAP